MQALQRASIFASLILAWGLSFPISKVALGYMPPLLLAGSRYLMAGTVLLGVALVRRQGLDLREAWRTILISAVLNVIVSNTLATVAVAYLGADIAVTLVYLQPILTALLAWPLLQEPLTLRKVLALLLGGAGVVVIGGASLVAHLTLLGIAAGLVSALAWALGTVFLKRSQNHGQHAVPSVWLISLQFLVSGGVVLTISRGVERWPVVHWTLPFVLSLAYLGIGALAVGWILWLKVIAMNEVSRITALIYCVPMVSVVVSALLLQEWPGTWTSLGIAAIVFSVFLVSRTATTGAAARAVVEEPARVRT